MRSPCVMAMVSSSTSGSSPSLYLRTFQCERSVTEPLSQIDAPNPRRFFSAQLVADLRGGLYLARVALAEEDRRGRIAGEQRADDGAKHRLLAVGEAARDLVAGAAHSGDELGVAKF